MPTKPIAIEGFQYTLTPADAGGLAQLQVVLNPVLHTKVNNAKPIVADTTFSLSNYMDGSAIDVPSSGATTSPFKFTPTVQHDTIEGSLVIVNQDQVTVTVSGLKKVEGGGTTPVSLPVTIQITDAGQQFVKAQ